MIVSDELVRQEVSELYRFIEPMIRLCSELRPDYPVFSNESRKFFGHIQKLGDKTLQYLEGAPNEILKDPRLSSTKRQRLLELRYLWESLHEFIRPALDADSLHLPNSLIAALHDRIHQTEEWRTYRFTLFHTAEANYLQLPLGMVGDIANDIATLVGGERFPSGLGHIGIPYSQADGLFLNCTLAHEMAHFIYQEDVSHDAEERIDDALDRMVQEIGDLDDDGKSLCVRLVGNWVQEVFCDLFAICLIGPAFSFAFSQLISASMLIGTRNGIPENFYKFSTVHPAEISRFRYHRKLLAKLGWWEQIRNWSCAPVGVLRACTRDKSPLSLEADDNPPATVTPARLFQCYDEVCNWLIGEVSKRVKGCRDSIATFESQSKVIADYLQRAIVPSTIVIRGKVTYPKPVTLINAGYKFLLENLRSLLTNVESEKPPDSIEFRSYLTSRLELWLLKALEDYRLLTGGIVEQ